VRSRALGRDPGLSARMLLALALLLLAYGGIVLGVVTLFRSVPSWWPYWMLVAIGLGASVVAHYRSAESLLLRSVDAKLVPREQKPSLYELLERLAALAEIPAPRLALIETEAANAFAVGLTGKRSVVVVTLGLQRRLSRAELEAVLAHELAHIVNRDSVVMTATSVPRTAGSLLIGGEGIIVWWLIWPLGVPLWLLGTLFTLTVSRYREYSADRGSALLTGAPEQLMSALQKLSGDRLRIPHADLRQLAPVEALWIIPTQEHRFEFLMDHPPLAKRLARLGALAHELGKAGA
jgi:heat shock protein HtpX